MLIIFKEVLEPLTLHLVFIVCLIIQCGNPASISTSYEFQTFLNRIAIFSVKRKGKFTHLNLTTIIESV